MRQTKFRAKSKETGGWEYVYYVARVQSGQGTLGHFISGIGGRWIEVLKETVGQFTGLFDKNGEEIYEGDIVKWEAYKGEVRFGIYPYPGFHIWEDGEPMRLDPGSNKYPDKSMWEVIGNIYENPELLKS